MILFEIPLLKPIKMKKDVCIPEHVKKKIAEETKEPEEEKEKEKKGVFKVEGIYKINNNLLVTGKVVSGMIKRGDKCINTDAEVYIEDMTKEKQNVDLLIGGEAGLLRLNFKKHPNIKIEDFLEFENF